MNTRAAGLSDVGRCRGVNQDQLLIDPSIGLYAVADGMGGHAAGEVASRLAVESLAREMRAEPGTTPTTAVEGAERLRLALGQVNKTICESMLAREDWRGMGTTLVTMLALGDAVVIGHVGDSRAYRLRAGRLERLTSDHSWVNEQVKHGLLSEEEAQRHPMRNIVTRAIGNQAHVEVELREDSIQAGDVFLLCSDGLSSMVRDPEIREIVARHQDDPQQACRALVDRANERGGEDNITVLVLAAHD